MLHDDGYFDERIADRYDESAADQLEPNVVNPIVDFLAEMAGSGRALELGVGTGRIALPLARRGVRVHGIDLFDAMVRRLRAKPGGDKVGVTVGDFSAANVPGTFAVAYLVVIEVGVPDLRRLPPGETVRMFKRNDTRWGFDEYDVATQGLVSHHFEIVDGRLERFSIPFRYVCWH